MPVAIARPFVVALGHTVLAVHLNPATLQENFAQHVARALYARFRARERESLPRCEILLCRTLKLRDAKRAAIRGRERIEKRQQATRQFLMDATALIRGLPGQIFRQLLQPLSRPVVIHQSVAGDLVQPWPKLAGILQLPAVRVGLEDDVLNDILGERSFRHPLADETQKLGPE